MFMFPLNIQNDIIYFRDIKPKQLPQILDWYNNIDDFRFATGLDTPISMEILLRKYSEAAISSDEFFTGIYIRQELRMVGILKGRLHNRNKGTIWINSIAIDPDYQCRGYGSISIGLLLKYLKTHINAKSVFLSVIEENTRGIAFWLNQGFRKVKKIEDYIKLQERGQNVIIMRKDL